jgi:hypothetical protein
MHQPLQTKRDPYPQKTAAVKVALRADRFPLPLRLERTAPFRAVLITPFVFLSELLGEIVVEAGFDTDYASVPRPLWSLYPPDASYTEAAIIHDGLYWHQHTAEPTEANLAAGLARPVTRAQADAVFLEAMVALGVPVVRRRVLYRAVRVGGGRAWENNARHRAGLPPVEHTPRTRSPRRSRK